MTEKERIQSLEAVQIQLFELSKQQEQLRFQFRKLQKSRKVLSGKIVGLRRQVRRLLPLEMKQCRKCRVEMLMDCFYIDSRYKDNRFPYCKYCRSDMYRTKRRAA
jgi:hypothetical protein